MRIAAFGVEQWMNEYETACAFNLAETCVESITFGELLALTGTTDSVVVDLSNVKLTYGAITGSARLRTAVASLYARQAAENVLVTHGAIGANALLYATLVEPGDQVVSVFPTYQQHHSLPESYGADVRRLTLREDHGFLPDLDELARLVGPQTKLIAINNPNNPTGSLMDESVLRGVADIARACGAYVLCDEVYRGTDQHGNGYTASMADIYDKGISTASMSKTYSLAGLRLGWIAGPAEVLGRVEVHRDYTTISVGMLDDYFAALALEHRDALLVRNHAILRDNLAILDGWIAAEPSVSYVKPRSGCTALVKYAFDLPSRDFCIRLLEQHGVMFTPGSAMGMEGYVRVGFANNRRDLETGLALTSTFLASLSR